MADLVFGGVFDRLPKLKIVSGRTGWLIHFVQRADESLRCHGPWLKAKLNRLPSDCGASRLMWGSNFPATHDRPLKEQLALAREELSFVAAAEQRRLFGETALSLWPELR